MTAAALADSASETEPEVNDNEQIMASKDAYTVSDIDIPDDLMEMEPACLRALFRERIHHCIEVEIYPILRGSKKLPPRFGLQPQLILEVWKERGFSDDDPDFQWGKKYLELAAKLRAGETIEIDEPLPTPFTEAEMTVVQKLIWDRRSVRDWISIAVEAIPGQCIDDWCGLDILPDGHILQGIKGIYLDVDLYDARFACHHRDIIRAVTI